MGVEILIVLALTVVGAIFYWWGYRSDSILGYILAVACFFSVAGLLQVEGIREVSYTLVNFDSGIIMDIYSNVTSSMNLGYMAWQWLSIGYGFISILGVIRSAMNED